MYVTMLLLKRCFDLSGECKRWMQEGFCDDPKIRTGPQSFYVRQNPEFPSWVRQNCVVSCKIPCMADKKRRVMEKSEYHTPFTHQERSTTHEF